MRTLIISDVHLCGVVPSTGSLMVYRQRENLLDMDLAALLSQARADEIVLNGDVFDFDAPDPVHPVRDRSEVAAVRTLAAILYDHPEVISALANSRARIVVIPGNHDAALAYPEVQLVLSEMLRRPITVTSSHVTEGIHIEHGHQWDPLCANTGPEADTIGTVVSWYMPLLLGCSNPYASDPLDTSFGELLEGVHACAIGAQTTWDSRLSRQFLSDLMMVRGETTMAGLIANRAWKGYGAQAVKRLRAGMCEIARASGVRGVVMGHTHQAFGETVDGVTYCNTGSWTPRVGTANGGTSPGSFVWIDGGRAEMRYW